jgi:Tol biopolymer transport system component
MNHRHPGYLPDGTLIFVEGLRHSPTALKKLVGTLENGQPKLEKIFNKGQYGDYDITRDGKYLYYANSHGRNNFSSFEDVFRLDLATGASTNLTEYARIGQPGISPDGKTIVAVQNGKGHNNLILLDEKGKLLRKLTNLEDNTQFTAPRWSPDGSKIVMSAWRGASRDLFMVDTSTWQTFPLWKDSPVDGGPVWTPDGQYVIFASDRDGGVYNLFAYDWQKREIWQITNVLTGVYEPAISPDGKELAMAYCRGVGYDIHTMPLDPSTWTKASPPAVDPTIKPYVFKQTKEYQAGNYTPLPSLLPKFWSPLYQSNPSSVGLFTIGYDVLITNTIFGYAGWSLAGNGYTDTESKQYVPFSPLDNSLATFLYQNSQFRTTFSLFGNWYPFRYGIPLNNGQTLELFQRFQNYSVTLGFNNVPSPLTNASYQIGDTHNLAYNVRFIQDMTPTKLNDEARAAKLIPQAGRAHSISYVYKYNDNGKYGYSISPEYGAMNTLGAEVAHPALGSEFDYYRGFAEWRRWFPAGLTHHVVALRSLLGANLGKPQGDFYLGGNRSVNPNGTPDIRVAADPDDVLLALRGYPFASATGNTAALLSTEYRFPLMEFQHGPGTLPLFAERLAATFFVDGGTTWTNNWLSFAGRTADKGSKPYPELSDLRAGVGGELRLNFKIANNPLNTVPLATIARSAVPALQALNDSSGIFRLGVAQPALPVTQGGTSTFLGPTVYTEFGTFF